MGKYTFEKHIDTINDIMQDTGSKLAALDAAIQTERERIQAGRRAPNVSPAKLQVLSEERESLEKKYREDVDVVIAEAKQAAQEARNALEKEAGDFAAVHPEDVDAATVALLNAGIVEGGDLVRLVNENGENVTMLRLLCAQAERLMEDNTTARALVAQIKVFVSPEARLSVFDGAMLNAHIGAGGDLLNIAAEAWEGGIYQKYRADMKELNTFTFQEG